MNLVGIYGPSGCGKTTLQTKLLDYRPDKFVRVILDTDRPLRKDEQGNPIEFKGKDYHFVSPEEFAGRKYLFSITHGDRNYGVSLGSEAIQEISGPTSEKIGIIVGGRKLIEKIKHEGGYDLFLIQMLLGIDKIRSSMFKRGDKFHDVLERLRDIYNQEIGIDGSLRVTRGYNVAEIYETILSHYSLGA